MDAEEVQYSMTLSDHVSGKLDEADKHAERFEKRMGSLGKGIHLFGERAVRVLETLGVSFAAIRMEEFFHEGTEMAHHFDVAVGQLENTLKNVGERAGLSAKQMVQMAEDSAKVMPFTKEQFVDMETALSRFGNMTPKVFQRVLGLSADMAVALKRDGRETALEMGRIFEAPAENARLLRQMGITLDMQQRKLLNTMEHTGHVAKAQTYLFQLLAEKGFAGAAKAAADSDPLFRYNKIMERLKYSVGGAGVTMLETLAPALERVANIVETSISYLQRHKEIAEGLAITVGSLTSAYVTYLAYEKAIAIGEWAIVTAKKAANFISGEGIAISRAQTAQNEAEAASAEAMAGAYGQAASAKGFQVAGFMGGEAAAGIGVGEVAAEGAVGASMFTGIGEVLAVVAGLGTLIYGISQMHSGGGEDSKTAAARSKQIDGLDKTSTSLDGLSSSSDSASSAVQTFAQKTSDAITTINQKIEEAQKRLNELTEGNKAPESRQQKAARVMGDFEQSLIAQRKKAELEHEQFVKDSEFIQAHGWGAYMAREKHTASSTLSKLQKQRDKLMGKLNPSDHSVGEVSKVTGSHPVNIHIKIDSLVKGFTIATTNLPETAARVKEEITKVLLSAVNDSQIVAGVGG